MIPDDLMYAKSHEWVRMNGDVAEIGITFFAQEQLGDLTFVEMPAVGDAFKTDDEIGSVESVKAASELYAPVAGEVVEINTELETAPEIVNDDPYGKGWILKIKASEAPKDLLTAEQYAALTTDG